MFYDLKKIRDSYDLTQREMASKLNIGKSSYNYFETGEHIIPLKHLNNFCNLFNVSMDYICKLTDTNIPTNNISALDSKLIGERIKKVRLKNKVTQVKLASILNTSQSNISAYESGKNLILTAFIFNIAKHFDISLDYLAGRCDTIKVVKRGHKPE